MDPVEPCSGSGEEPSQEDLFARSKRKSRNDDMRSLKIVARIVGSVSGPKCKLWLSKCRIFEIRCLPHWMVWKQAKCCSTSPYFTRYKSLVRLRSLISWSSMPEHHCARFKGCSERVSQ